VKEQQALAGRIQQALSDLEQVVQRVEALAEKARQTGDMDYLDGVSLNLHGFYTGVERIFEDIARHVDESMPTGPEWHRDLLLQMSAALRDVRPPVISQATRAYLNEYRGFRHVVRNLYTFNLRPTRVLELSGEIRNCYEAIALDLQTFMDFLWQLTQTGED
jgi:hypothetical protein